MLSFPLSLLDCIPSYWRLGRAHHDCMTCRLSDNPGSSLPPSTEVRVVLPFTKAPRCPPPFPDPSDQFAPLGSRNVHTWKERTPTAISHTLAPHGDKGVTVALSYICCPPYSWRTCPFSVHSPISLIGGAWCSPPPGIRYPDQQVSLHPRSGSLSVVLMPLV